MILSSPRPLQRVYLYNTAAVLKHVDMGDPAPLAMNHFNKRADGVSPDKGQAQNATVCNAGELDVTIFNTTGHIVA